MSRNTYLKLSSFIIGLILLSCGQDLVVPCPTCSTDSQDCDADDDSADGGEDSSDSETHNEVGCAENETTITQGNTLPCLKFESASQNGENTILDIKGLAEQLSAGTLDAKALVFMLGALNCTECEQFVLAMSAHKNDFDAAGAYMVGVLRTKLGDIAVDVDLAEAIAQLNIEGWPAEWVITNDPESALGPRSKLEQTTAPWILLVRLSDFKVIVFNFGVYFSNDVEKLLDDINDIEQL